MHAARLCLNLHVVECVECGVDPLTPVSLETMQRAIVLTEWFLSESSRIYDMFGGVEEAKVEMPTAAVLNAIRQKGVITKAKLHNLQVFKKSPHPAALIDHTLDELLSAGVIMREFDKSPNGGRGKEVFMFSTEGIDSVTDCGTIEHTDECRGFTSAAAGNELTKVNSLAG